MNKYTLIISGSQALNQAGLPQAVAGPFGNGFDGGRAILGAEDRAAGYQEFRPGSSSQGRGMGIDSAIHFNDVAVIALLAQPV